MYVGMYACMHACMHVCMYRLVADRRLHRGHHPSPGATEPFANPVEGFASEPASQSLARMQAQDIANKMDIFTQINRKRDKFKQEMAGIQKDLAGVKEFYVNAAKSDPRRGKRGRKGGKK